MVQAKIGHNPIQPGMETAVEPEVVEVSVDPQECFLIDVTGVLRGAKEVKREPKHTLVVGLDKLFEGVMIASLRRSDQSAFI
jgi:hypothetical protein